LSSETYCTSSFAPATEMKAVDPTLANIRNTIKSEVL
jgi:hypothetical protein